MKATPPERSRPLYVWAAPFVAAAVMAAALNDCRSTLSKAKGQTSDVKCEAGMGVINNEPDAGVNVKVTLTNVGEAGYIKVNAELSTSEGEWSRSQNLQFGKGESRPLTYFFHEPTIMAENIQCRVNVHPQADD